MSKRNIFALAMLGAALFAGTAAADGKTKRVYKPGPAPLNTTCPTGYAKNNLGQCVRLSKTPTCPSGTFRDSRGQCVRPAPRTTTCPTGYSKDSQGNCFRQAQRPAPRPVPRPAPRPAPVQQASFDLSGFNGGVGAGVNGGYYGGGGFIQTAPLRRFSGVLDAPGAAFAFNQRATRAPSRPAPRPRPSPRPKGGRGYK